MKRVLTGTCLAMLCTVGLAAQTPAEDQKRKAPAMADEKTVVLTGCLRAGDAPNSFVLANVTPAEAAGKTATAPTPPMPPTPPTEPPSTPPSVPPTPPSPPDPAVGTAGATASKDVRIIDAPANVKLSEHVGHTVEITGTFVPAAKATRPTGTTGTEDKPGSDLRTFKLKSMAHKSATCK